MKKDNAINIKLNKLKIKDAYMVKHTNLLQKFIDDNSETMNLLNREVDEMLKNKWIYIKNKKVYYNTIINSLIPDLIIFPIGFCPIREKFNDDSLKLQFGQYKGRIATYNELLKLLDGDGCIQGIQYYNYTVFLNGIRYIDKDKRNVLKCFEDSTNRYLSYHIPIYELGKNKTIIDENGYDLKYIDGKAKINSISDVVNMWLEYELIPEGLSMCTEQFYKKLMELSKTDVNKYIVSYKKLNNIKKRRKSNE